MTLSSNGALAIPLTRLDNADPELLEELLAVVDRVARSAAFTLGEEVDRFDAEFAEYCGSRHAVGLSSGTEALVLALRALGVGPGDEVIVPANSFIATAEAVTLVGGIPRFVDVDPETAVVTAELIEPAIGLRTRCVIPVHLYGRTVELEPIVALARDAGLAVIEDACQAHGALLRGRRAGSIADCGCFSFYPAKNLGAWGDGGALVTDDEAIADHVRLLRSHGERPRYHHQVAGTTARLDALQAAILRVKLRRLDGWNHDRREIAARLNAALADTPVLAPVEPPATGDHVYHQYVVTVSERDMLRDHLAAHGIATAIHYPVPIHLSPAYESCGLRPGSLPVAELLARESCSLPMHPWLRDDEIARIAEAIAAFRPAISFAA
jgi:dTDP-3-amino-3,4,6-trideoxy-alpha-D-glucose transaminase